MLLEWEGSEKLGAIMSPQQQALWGQFCAITAVNTVVKVADVLYSTSKMRCWGLKALVTSFGPGPVLAH